MVLTDSLGEASMNSEKPGKDNLNDSTVEVSDWDVGTAGMFDCEDFIVIGFLFIFRD